MTRDEIIFALCKSGLVTDPANLPPGKTLADLVAQFQAIHGLAVDGEVGPATARVLDMPRFCQVPDRVSTTRCRWDGQGRPLAITWHLTATLPGISMNTMREIFAAAWKSWADVCGIAPQYSANAKTANVVHNMGQIDGPSSTLAWSKLPCGPDQQLDQLYDNSEPWDISLGSPTLRRVSLKAVACHEIGHVIGLEHGGNGLMQPFYSDSILTPQSGYDIDEAVLRYGQPAPAPAPPPPPPGVPGKFTVNAIGSTGEHYYGELKRISGQHN